MKHLLTEIDMYSSKVYFTINSGCKRNKTIIGGIITLISLIIMIILSLLLLVRFFFRSSSNVLTSYHSTEQLELPLHTYPYLLRLSTEKVKSYEERERLYTISLKLKVGGGNNTSQWTDDIAMEQCDINKHFGDYSELFRNISDINTYLCPSYRMDNQSVIGIYGGKHLFQYFHFYITMCINTTKNNNHCVDKQTMNTKLKATYLDVLTVDYNIDKSTSHNKPYTMYVRSDRHLISNTLYKRVWMYIASVDYYKDVGLIFENNYLYSFFQVHSFRYDMDMRDIYNDVTIPGTFANLSVMNHNIKQNYHASFMKLQEFFANVGGLLKMIHMISFMLNYVFSEAAYKERILEYIFDTVYDNNKSNSNNKGRNGCDNNNNNKNTLPMKITLNNNNNSNHQSLTSTAIKNGNLSKHCTLASKLAAKRTAMPGIAKHNSSSKLELVANKSVVAKGFNTQIYNVNKSELFLLSKENSWMNMNTNLLSKKTNDNRPAMNVLQKMWVLIMFNKNNRQMYFDNYKIIKEELDIKYYLRIKQKMIRIDDYYVKKLIEKQQSDAVQSVPSLLNKAFEQSVSNSVNNENGVAECKKIQQQQQYQQQQMYQSDIRRNHVLTLSESEYMLPNKNKTYKASLFEPKSNM